MTDSLLLQKPHRNRITPVLKGLIGTEDADDLMLSLIEVLSDTVTPVPDLGNYYTFIYRAKTPNITYDTNPLVAVTEYHPTGFKGFNFHWGTMRNYTFLEVVGQLYYVNPAEIDELKTLPYQNFVLNN